MTYKKEAIVLDKLNKEIKFKQTPIIQSISTSNFSLLEIICDSDKSVKIFDTISTEDQIVRRITYDRLTDTSKKELEKAIETIVLTNTNKFVDFFNTAKPIGLRRHQLDLLPMIGVKHRMAILEHLKKHGKFTSFDDIRKIEMLPDPVNIITNRVLEEIKEGQNNKFNLFTVPFLKPINQ